MSSKKLKPFAVSVSVKPKADGIVKYGMKTYRGIAMAKTSNEAKELSVDVILKSFQGNDGSTITRPIIDRSMIKIKDCRIVEDFFVNPDILNKTEKTE